MTEAHARQRGSAVYGDRWDSEQPLCDVCGRVISPDGTRCNSCAQKARYEQQRQQNEAKIKQVNHWIRRTCLAWKIPLAQPVDARAAQRDAARDMGR